MQKPASIRAAAKNPQSCALVRGHDVIVPLNVLASPPSGRNALRSPGAHDALLLAGPAQPERWSIRNYRHDLDSYRPGPQPKRTQGLARLRARPAVFLLPALCFSRPSWRCSLLRHLRLDQGLEATGVLGLEILDQAHARHGPGAQAAAEAVHQGGRPLEAVAFSLPEELGLLVGQRCRVGNAQSHGADRLLDPFAFQPGVEQHCEVLRTVAWLVQTNLDPERRFRDMVKPIFQLPYSQVLPL